MPKKKGSKKGKKKESSAKTETNLIPGIVSGGLPLVALTPQGRAIEVAELRFASIKSLKQRIFEAGKVPVETMRLFMQVGPKDPMAKDARQVSNIEGYQSVFFVCLCVRVCVCETEETRKRQKRKERENVCVSFVVFFVCLFAIPPLACSHTYSLSLSPLLLCVKPS